MGTQVAPDLGVGSTYLGVDNFVSAERAGLAEAFAANFTHERSGSRVDWHVAGEIIVSVKYLGKDTRDLVVRLATRDQWLPSTIQPKPPSPFGN